MLARYYNSDDGAWRMSYSRSINYAAGYTTAKVTRDDARLLGVSDMAVLKWQRSTQSCPSRSRKA